MVHKWECIVRGRAVSQLATSRSEAHRLCWEDSENDIEFSDIYVKPVPLAVDVTAS